MRTADGFRIDFAHSPMQDFTLFDKLTARFRHYLDRRIRVYAVLVKHSERFHSEITQGVLAYTANVCRSAVLFGFHLYAVHEFVSEF